MDFDINEYCKILDEFNSVFIYHPELINEYRYTAPHDGYYVIKSHYFELKSGDIVDFDETGKPFIVK